MGPSTPSGRWSLTHHPEFPHTHRPRMGEFIFTRLWTEFRHTRRRRVAECRVSRAAYPRPSPSAPPAPRRCCARASSRGCCRARRGRRAARSVDVAPGLLQERHQVAVEQRGTSRPRRSRPRSGSGSGSAAGAPARPVAPSALGCRRVVRQRRRSRGPRRGRAPSPAAWRTAGPSTSIAISAATCPAARRRPGTCRGRRPSGSRAPPARPGRAARPDAPARARACRPSLASIGPDGREPLVVDRVAGLTPARPLGVQPGRRIASPGPRRAARRSAAAPRAPIGGPIGPSTSG